MGAGAVAYCRSMDAAAGSSVNENPGLLLSRPPGGFASVRRWVVDSPRGLSPLRAALQAEVDTRLQRPAGADRADAADAADEIGPTMALVASELVTNAIVHARPPAVVELLHQSPARFLLTVVDQDPGSTPAVVSDRSPGDGGLGLQIASGLAVASGWYRTSQVKVVWAELSG